jgi:hypothetical protein
MTSDAVTFMNEITQTLVGLEDVFQPDAAAFESLAHTAQFGYG